MLSQVPSRPKKIDALILKSEEALSEISCFNTLTSVPMFV